MKIKQVIANNFMGSDSLMWDLDPNVNVLSGINGSGKSTLLRAIDCSLRKKPLPESLMNRIGEIKVELVGEDDGTTGVSFISTFDMPAALPTNAGELMDQILKSYRSELDRHLEIVVDNYKSYLVEQSIRLSQIKEDFDVLDFLKTTTKSRTNLQDIIDSLFANTGKAINRQKGEVEFIFNSDGQSHPHSDLSAGEKQLLLILLTVYLQEGKEAVLLMDEPEISLHVDWQMDLINVIQRLNPNCQIVVATHSPSMILRGWQEFVQNISDLKSR